VIKGTEPTCFNGIEAGLMKLSQFNMKHALIRLETIHAMEPKHSGQAASAARLGASCKV